MSGMFDLGDLTNLTDNERQSHGSSLSSSRDEEQISYTPIYPSYSSSFSNSSLEFHESLLLAIQERQQQQLLQQQQHQQQQHPQAHSQQYLPLSLSDLDIDTDNTTQDTQIHQSHPHLPTVPMYTSLTDNPRPFNPINQATFSSQSHFDEQPVHPENWSQTESIHSQLEQAQSHSPRNRENLSLHINPSDRTLPSPPLSNTLSLLEYRQDQGQNNTTRDTSDDQPANSVSELGRRPLSDSHNFPSLHDNNHRQPQSAITENLRTTVPTRARSVSASVININSSSLSRASVEQGTSLILDEFSAMPRALPRRRYATRDYSSGSVSSDDWLRHPDVVLFTNTESTVTQPETLRNENQLPDRHVSRSTVENQEIIQPPRQTVESMPEINISLVPTPATLSHITETPYTPIDDHARVLQSGIITDDSTNVQNNRNLQGDQTATRLTRPLDIAEQANVEPAAEQSAIDMNQELTMPSMQNTSQDQTTPELSESPAVGQSDRLGLLGPLLSGTGATSLAAPDIALGLSLLGSTRPGFDSSILSMASRIRQARLIRLLRRINESEVIDYPEGRDTRDITNHLHSRGGSRSSVFFDSEVAYHDGQNTVQQELTGSGVSRSIDNANASLSFTEILDCNGNSIVWGDNNTLSSSSGFPTNSNNITETGETQRLRRRLEHIGRDRGMIRTQGRSRVVSTGTAFEGMEFISEADNLLARTHRNQSLKASWVTNPNGECWSDDDLDNSQSQSYGDAEDKEQDSGFVEYSSYERSNNRFRNHFGEGAESYPTYSRNIGNHAEENARRRRVVSEMSDLLRREQEWERELELYERELAAFRSRLLSRGTEPRSGGGEYDETSTSPSRRPGTSMEDVSMESTSPSMDLGTNNHISHVDPLIQLPTENYDEIDEIVVDHVHGLQEYEQGHADYHVQSSSSFGLPRDQNAGAAILGSPTATTTSITNGSNHLRTQWQQQSMPGNQTDISQHLSVPNQSAVGAINRTNFRAFESNIHHIRRGYSPRMQFPRRRLGMGQIFEPQLHREYPAYYAPRNPLSQQQRQQRLWADIEQSRRLEESTELSDSNNNTFFVPPPSEPSTLLRQDEEDEGVFPSRVPVMEPSSSMEGSNRWNALRTNHEENQDTRLWDGSILEGGQRSRNSRFAITTDVGRIGENEDNTEVSGSMEDGGGSGLINSAGNLTDNGNLDGQQRLNWQEAQQRARERISNSLYVDCEGGTLRQEERWRRGNMEMIGR